MSHYVTKDGLSPQYHGWGIQNAPNLENTVRAEETMRLKTTNLNIKEAEMKRKPSKLRRILNVFVLSFLNKFHNHFSNRAWPFYVRKVSTIWYLSYSRIWQFAVQSLHYKVKGITLLSNCVELQKWWKGEILKRKTVHCQHISSNALWRDSIQAYLNRHDGSFCVIISMYAYRKRRKYYHSKLVANNLVFLTPYD